MLTGIYAVQNSLLKKKHDLWSVNADQEYHEEIKTGVGRNQQYVAEAIERGLAEVLQKVDRFAFGVGLGVVCGLGISLMTVVLLLKGGNNVGENLALLRNYLPGYSVTPLGAVLGFIYGCVAGFGIGWCTALFRNTVMFLYFAIIRRRVERGFMTDLVNWI